MIHHVNTYWINLRSEPSLSRDEIIASLPHGHEVRKLNISNNWWYVGTYYEEHYLEGYVDPKYLSKGGVKPRTIITPEIPKVSLLCENYEVSPDSYKRAQSLSFSHGPTRVLTSIQTRTSSIWNIINYLDVENSKRYAGNGRQSFSNIYVHDYVHLCGAYIPRVWWTERALIAVASGEELDIQYGVTVNETSANRLYDWLHQWGKSFGWRRFFHVHKVQEAANSGRVCLLSAKRRQTNASGHICAIIPESERQKAIRMQGKVKSPLMSQAGPVNKQCFTRRWWTSNKYSFFGFWVHQ